MAYGSATKAALDTVTRARTRESVEDERARRKFRDLKVLTVPLERLPPDLKNIRVDHDAVPTRLNSSTVSCHLPKRPSSTTALPTTQASNSRKKSPNISNECSFLRNVPPMVIFPPGFAAKLLTSGSLGVTLESTGHNAGVDEDEKVVRRPYGDSRRTSLRVKREYDRRDLPSPDDGEESLCSANKIELCQLDNCQLIHDDLRDVLTPIKPSLATKLELCEISLRRFYTKSRYSNKCSRILDYSETCKPAFSSKFNPDKFCALSSDRLRMSARAYLRRPDHVDDSASYTKLKCEKVASVPAVADLATLSSHPNLEILSPADNQELPSLTKRNFRDIPTLSADLDVWARKTYRNIHRFNKTRLPSITRQLPLSTVRKYKDVAHFTCASADIPSINTRKLPSSTSVEDTRSSDLVRLNDSLPRKVVSVGKSFNAAHKVKVPRSSRLRGFYPHISRHREYISRCDRNELDCESINSKIIKRVRLPVNSLLPVTDKRSRLTLNSDRLSYKPKIVLKRLKDQFDSSVFNRLMEKRTISLSELVSSDDVFVNVSIVESDAKETAFPPKQFVKSTCVPVPTKEVSNSKTPDVRPSIDCSKGRTCLLVPVVKILRNIELQP